MPENVESGVNRTSPVVVFRLYWPSDCAVDLIETLLPIVHDREVVATCASAMEQSRIEETTQLNPTGKVSLAWTAATLWATPLLPELSSGLAADIGC